MAAHRYSEDEIRDKLEQAEALFEQGSSAAGVARALAVSPSTLRRWQISASAKDDLDLTRPSGDPHQLDPGAGDDALVTLQADLAHLKARYVLLVKTVSALGFVVALVAILSIVWAPWNSSTRTAQDARNGYDAIERAFLSCSTGTVNAALGNCYRSYGSSLANVAWPSQAQPTATAIETDAKAIASELTSGQSTATASAQLSSDEQVLSTTLDVLAGK